MKKLTLMICCLVLHVIIAKAQSFKVTSLETSDARKYQEMAQRYLGKTMTLQFYDNAVSLSESGDPILYLKKVTDNEYQYYNKDSSGENIMIIDLHYTVGVLTSITITATAKNSSGTYSNTVTANAKRF